MLQPKYAFHRWLRFLGWVGYIRSLFEVMGAVTILTVTFDNTCKV